MAFGFLKKCGIKSWSRDENGVVAVEFALLAMPFIMTLMGMIEIALFFAAGTTLEGAAQSASRSILTGQVQASLDPVGVFEAELCGAVGVLIPCDEIVYEVVEMGDGQFATADALEPTFDEDGNLVPQGFDAGGSESVILIRVAHRYQFLTPFMSGILDGGAGTGSALLMATVVMRVEPYDFSVGGV